MNGAYPRSIITSDIKEGSESTLIAPEESKSFYNSSVPAASIFSDALSNTVEAEIKIYVLRKDFDQLNLDSDIECHESTIRQIFQSQRFRLR
jgi:hypothetical protein